MIAAWVDLDVYISLIFLKSPCAQFFPIKHDNAHLTSLRQKLFNEDMDAKQFGFSELKILQTKDIIVMFLLLFSCAIKPHKCSQGVGESTQHIIEKAFIFFTFLSQKHQFKKKSYVLDKSERTIVRDVKGICMQETVQ